MRTFSFQNMILTPNRNKFLIQDVGKKLFVMYTKFYLSEEEINLVLRQAGLEWGMEESKFIKYFFVCQKK